MSTTVVVNMSTCEIILTYPTNTPSTDVPKIPYIPGIQYYTTTMDEDPATLEAFLDENGGVKFRPIS